MTNIWIAESFDERDELLEMILEMGIDFTVKIFDEDYHRTWKVEELPRPKRKSKLESGDSERIPFNPTINADDVALDIYNEIKGEKIAEHFKRIVKTLNSFRADKSHEKSLQKGASYKQLAMIAHLVDMPYQHRILWYKLAEKWNLSSAHAGHIIKSLTEDRE